MRKIFLCTQCAHHNHKFEIPQLNPGVPNWVIIDGEKWISYHRSPSKAVKCSECGKRTRYVFEKLTGGRNDKEGADRKDC